MLSVAEHVEWLMTFYVDKWGKFDSREERVVYVIVSYQKPHILQCKLLVKGGKSIII